MWGTPSSALGSLVSKPSLRPSQPEPGPSSSSVQSQTLPAFVLFWGSTGISRPLSKNLLPSQLAFLSLHVPCSELTSAQAGVLAGQFPLSCLCMVWYHLHCHTDNLFIYICIYNLPPSKNYFQRVKSLAYKSQPAQLLFPHRASSLLCRGRIYHSLPFSYLLVNFIFYDYRVTSHDPSSITVAISYHLISLNCHLLHLT